MSEVSRETVTAALRDVIDPASGRDVISSGIVKGLVIKGARVGFTLEVEAGRGASAEPLREACAKAVGALAGVEHVTAVLTAHHDSAPAAPTQTPHPAPTQSGVPGVGAIIAVASGKGGVGKSTLAVNLALAFRALGKRVGLLDADVYGPSVPRLLGLTGKPRTEGKKLVPMEAFGLKAMSMGFLVGEDTPMVWRGPMVVSALGQMLGEVNWAPLDILVVDMPPGTGDAQLTMAQRVPLAGAVVVSTPQDLALIDARKGLAMFRQTKVPILGIVENMSVFVCPSCGHESHIFGHGGARATAEGLGVRFLGEVPLVMRIRETSDAGTPIVARDPDSPETQAYLAIARETLRELSAGHRPPPAIKVLP